MSKHFLALCVGFALCVSVSPAEAAVFFCASGDVTCLIASIRASNAINNTLINDIFLEAGTYVVTEADPEGDGLTGLPLVTRRISIHGAGINQTIIQRGTDQDPFHQAPLFRLFSVAQGGFSLLGLDNLTLKRGNVGSSGQGGAIISRGGALSLRQIEIRDSYAGRGAAIYAAPEGSTFLFESRVTNNSADLGGGVLWGGFLTITRSSISRNSAESEGIVVGSLVSISESDLVGNTTHFPVVSIRSSTQTSLSPTISNTTIARTVGRSPAAISADRDVLVHHATIVNNPGGLAGTGPFRVFNTIVAGNDQFGDCANFGGDPGVVSRGHNLFGNPLGCGTLLPSDLTGDPGLGSEVDSGRPGGTYFPLLAGSRAIDGGEIFACSDIDQRGLIRRVDGSGAGIRACDIGAVEFYQVVNDRLELQGLQYSFVNPSNLGFVDPRASAGAFLIIATFGNPGPAICNLAFDVVSLTGPAGTNPEVVVPRELVGGQGAAIPAEKAAAPPHLPSGGVESYRFTIGVQQKTSINFNVNALGDATSGPCAQ